MCPELKQISENTYRCDKRNITIKTTDNKSVECNICYLPTVNKDNKQLSGPSIPQMAANFTEAMTKYAKSKFKHVSLEEYRQRLATCNKNDCGYHKGLRCLHPACGCFLAAKAWISTENCPMDLWAKPPDGV